MITGARFRTLCLAHEGATEVPHFDRAAFRVRKMFATLPPDGRTANLLLVPELQAAVVDAMPHAFSPVPGGWGRMGYTTVDLARVTEAELTPVLRESHALASEPPKKRVAPKKAPTKNAPTRKTSATKAPAEETPAKKTPTKKTPTKKTPAEKTPAKKRKASR